jgi:hypothetical protein
VNAGREATFVAEGCLLCARIGAGEADRGDQRECLPDGGEVFILVLLGGRGDINQRTMSMLFFFGRVWSFLTA